MFSKLPELLSRDFAIAYFLPVALFLVASGAVIELYGYLPAAIQINSANQIELLAGTTAFSLIAWFGGIVLLVLNRSLIRVLEGYGRFNPLRLLLSWQKRRYKHLHDNIKAYDEEFRQYKRKNHPVPDKLQEKRMELLLKKVERFPDEEKWLLPTSIGNTIRAFEVYPRVMYGLDTIVGWNRLQAVLPDSYRTLIDTAKAYFDFWFNLIVLSFLFVLEYVLLAAIVSEFRSWWILVIPFAVILVAYVLAEQAAVEWGDIVKAAFDVYVPALARKLGLPLPSTQEEWQSTWLRFSQAVAFERPALMPKRDWALDEEKAEAEAKKD